MILDIAPGVRTKIPMDADFQLQIASPFSGTELSLPGTVIAMDFRDFKGANYEILGTNTGSTLYFPLAANFFPAGGEYTANPRVVASGFVRRWPEPAILEVVDPLAEPSTCGGC